MSWEWPRDPDPAYSFEDWDNERLWEAGEFLRHHAARRDAVADMRKAILDLYFRDEGLEEAA